VRERILIVRLSSIGDTIQGTPVARQIKRAHPDCHLTWVVQPLALPCIQHNPHLDEIVVLDVPRPESWLELWRRVRGQYDITVDLQCLLKSGLVTWVANSPVRIGRAEGREGSRLFHTRLMRSSGDQHYISQLYLEQCSDLNLDRNDYVPEVFVGPEDQVAAATLWRELNLKEGTPVVALMPFASTPRREWPIERFAEVGDTLAAETGARCMIFGGRGERHRADQLATRMKSAPLVIAGRPSLELAIACLQRCKLALGNDSGLVHCAFALGTPVVCLLGRSPLHKGPTGDRAVTLFSPCEFRPCLNLQECARGAGCGCRSAITVDQTLEACRRMLRGRN
jgi:lipopolysaccharide heptosyltransferase II